MRLMDWAIKEERIGTKVTACSQVPQSQQCSCRMKGTEFDWSSWRRFKADTAMRSQRPETWGNRDGDDVLTLCQSASSWIEHSFPTGTF